MQCNELSSKRAFSFFSGHTPTYVPGNFYSFAESVKKEHDIKGGIYQIVENHDTAAQPFPVLSGSQYAGGQLRFPDRTGSVIRTVFMILRRTRIGSGIKRH